MSRKLLLDENIMDYAQTVNQGKKIAPSKREIQRRMAVIEGAGKAEEKLQRTWKNRKKVGTRLR